MTEKEPAKSLKGCRHDKHWVSSLPPPVGKYSTRELLDGVNGALGWDEQDTQCRETWPALGTRG